jgi:tRNA (guanine26-N2/guanine27-N2)-dimethyltransferase
VVRPWIFTLKDPTGRGIHLQSAKMHAEAREPFGFEDTRTIEDQPKAGQEIQHNGKCYTTVKEGLAFILLPKDQQAPTTRKQPEADGMAGQSVFYNPIQQYNRDLSVLAIRAFGESYLYSKWSERGRERFERRRSKRRHADANLDSDVVEELNHNGSLKRLKCGKNALEETVSNDSSGKENTTSVLVQKELVQQEVQVVGEGVNPSAQESATSADMLDNGVRLPGSEVDQATQESESKVEGPSSPKFRILDALSATGLRALRYAHELPFVSAVTANDLSTKAIEAIALNIKHNRLETKIHPIAGNAIAHMYSVAHPIKGVGTVWGKYEVVDLDPYGTAAPFLDAAVQSLSNGGLLCVTCTDSAVFASAGYPEKTYSLYGGLPVKGLHSHEGALRLVLHAISTAAARYGLAAEPLLSLSIDFYVRLFVRVRRSPHDVKFLAGKTMVIYSCDSGCGAWQTQNFAKNQPSLSSTGTSFFKHTAAQAPSTSPLCQHCGSKMHVSEAMFSLKALTVMLT